MATVSSINYNPQIMPKATSFGKNAEESGEKKSETKNEQKIIYVEKPRTKASKKWGVGIASYFLPGLGQLINGEGTGKVLGFFGSSMALGLLAYGSILSMGRNIFDNIDSTFSEILGKSGEKKVPKIEISTKNRKGNVALMGVALVGCLAVKIASIVDAVKHAKPDYAAPHKHKHEHKEIETEA